MNKIGESGIRQLFPERDFSGLTFNVIKTKGPVLESFPQLKELRSWKDYKKSDADKAMRFVILMFDPQTPLKEKVRVVEERRHMAAILSGWEPRDKGYEAITKLEDKDHLNMVADYLAYIGNRDWTMLIVAEMLFDRFTKMALTEGFGVAKGIPEELEEINKKLDTYYDKMFKDKDTATKIRRGKITAEKIAKYTSVQEN